MPTEVRARARAERARGRRQSATEPDDIPGQQTIFDALDHEQHQDQEEHSDG